MRLLLSHGEDPTRRYEWQDDAACQSVDSGLFFDADYERGEARLRREQAAKRICATCPVRAECLRFAESGPGEFGVWGGTTQQERISRRRRRYRSGASVRPRTRGEK